GGRGSLPNPDAVVRVWSPDGEMVYSRGEWPRLENHIRARLLDSDVPKRSLTAPWLLRRASWISAERAAESGGGGAPPLPARMLAALNAKIRKGVMVGSGIAAGTVLLIALGTTIRAFSPLRRATAMLRDVGTGSLGVRLASRRTGDPIDLHAETLNAVLERID